MKPLRPSQQANTIAQASRALDRLNQTPTSKHVSVTAIKHSLAGGSRGVNTRLFQISQLLAALTETAKQHGTKGTGLSCRGMLAAAFQQFQCR